MRTIILFIVLAILSLAAEAQEPRLPVMGLCIAAPERGFVREFDKFIREELAPLGVNTLVLRVDWNYEYETHPELRGDDPLTRKDVKTLVETCQDLNINLIPQVNLLGHQSWANKPGKLLEVYPQFDETPGVKMPLEYKWPNDDELYCKSYCPLHPEVHDIIFDIVGEIVDVFEANAFHAGMDEVFYIGDSKCPRCSGRDKAELFAGEVNLIHNFLAGKDCSMWIWGDRLLDGKVTGYGMWEASMNNTYRAIDLISKDVVICDWHYERPDLSAVMFAMKGFTVLTCPWRNPDVALRQLENTLLFISTATGVMKDRYAGILQTEWGNAERFVDEFLEIKKNGLTPGEDKRTAAGTFYLLTAETASLH